jgi:hypothetical protein
LEAIQFNQQKKRMRTRTDDLELQEQERPTKIAKADAGLVQEKLKLMIDKLSNELKELANELIEAKQ